MVKLQFKLPEALISRSFTRRTVFMPLLFSKKGLLHGCTSEFCREYLNHCKSNNLVSNAEGFFDWMSSIENETFNLVYQLVFNFAFAVYVLKMGVRCNDVNMINAGRYKFMPLFYAFNHPIYQYIEYRDLKNQVIYPKEVKKVLDDNMSFSKQLDHNHQGGDFSLEGKIKRLKMVAPKGRISNELWRRISRGLDDIENICECTNKKLNISEQDEYRDVELYDEIVSWRAAIRNSEMLSNHYKDGAIFNIYKELHCQKMSMASH